MFKRKLPKSRSTSSVVLEPEVAIAVIGHFSAVADDQGLSRTEKYVLSEMLASISQFEKFSQKDFEKLTSKVYGLLEKTKREDLFEQAIASLLDTDNREAAYITALLVVGIDDEVPKTEQNYISKLQEALKISDKRAQEIIDGIFAEDGEEEYG
ncbi:MAG: tellurite resistance TerB family protein [Mojavia pulchra JT2-VF2]|jgi:hypothetical protein|uniref:Tellurite resistance TerB family protein n=1 Tax=Mojavia pulchra JT2-VF2 TaxID=287848 RepID=A0A951UI83_9NOST|nr:tellurite resistance TerB family protein [Mojavia pulchra JT2-VF2]